MGRGTLHIRPSSSCFVSLFRSIFITQGNLTGTIRYSLARANTVLNTYIKKNFYGTLLTRFVPLLKSFIFPLGNLSDKLSDKNLFDKDFNNRICNMLYIV